MGLIYRGLPTDLVQEIVTQYKPDVFVETGTFKGDSLAEAKALFPVCYSIEIAEEFYKKAVERFQDEQSIHILLGSSAEQVKQIDFSNYNTAFFWLDAHYSGGPTGGEGSCPLLDEVEYIQSLPLEKFILIDDARHVLSPYEGERYCEIEQLFAILPADNYNVIINDIVISVPSKARPMMEAYCLRTTSEKKRKIKSKRVRALLRDLLGDLR